MNTTEEVALQTYAQNIAYIKEYQQALFDKLVAFDTAVEKNLYSNKYDLVVQDDYFDVLELASKNYLYGSSSDAYAKDAASSITFTKDTAVFESFKRFEIREEDLDKYEKIAIEDNNLSGVAPLLSIINQHLPKHSTMQQIKKFVFFGVGLGTHIVKIDEKISANHYLIIENDLELFKLSLFTTPYYELAKKAKLSFCIFMQTDHFLQDVEKFLSEDFWSNHYIKYFHMLSHNDNRLNEFHIKLTSQTHNLFHYSEILKQYIRPLEYLRDGYNFLNLVNLNNNRYFETKPILLLAAGPSLSKNMQWIQKNHTKFIVVALSATLSILEKNGISPDIVTHIDGLSSATVHFDKLNSLTFLQDTMFLLSAKTMDTVVKRLNKNHLFFFENGTSYKKDFGNLSAPCVGSLSYLLLLIFNVKELYLLGLDLALDTQTFCTHADGHEYGEKLDPNGVDDGSASYKKSIVKTLGNFTPEVPTTPEYKFSIDSINTSSKDFKSNIQKVYNLSDGAKFEHTIPTPAQDLSLKEIDKNSLRNELYSIFTLNSADALSDEEKNLLHAKTSYGMSVKKTILEQQNTTFDSVEIFLQSLITLYENIAVANSQTEHDLSLVYENYFRFIYTFVFDFFNTKELQNKEQYIDLLNAQLTKQLLRIELTYEDALGVESVEHNAVQTYEKNINYLKKYHSEVAQKLEHLQTQRYALEYHNGYFDVQEISSGHFLYAQDTNEVSKELTKQTNFKKNHNTFEGFALYHFNDETLANLNDKTRCLDGIYPIMNYYIDHSSRDDEMLEIEKFIFIGVGLGIHLPLIQEKTAAKECLVIEDDLELFRLSLFTTPYYELAKKTKIFFSIAEEEHTFLQTMGSFLQSSILANRYLKYSYFPAHSQEKIKQIQNALATQSFVTFPYKTELEKFLRPLEYINDGYNIINLSKTFQNSVFSIKPVLLLGAGPSFEKNLNWIKQNHKKFIIVALSATLKTLYENKITPDLVTHLDGFEDSLVHYDGFDAQSFLKNSSAVLGPFSPSKLRTIFTKEKIFYYEENTSYFDGFGSIVAPCIGSFTLLLSLKLAPKELYLLGLDFALDNTGATHADSHAYAEQKDMSQKESLSSVTSLKENLLKVKGNLQEVVYTTPLYHQSIHSLFHSIPEVKLNSQHIYNLSDGAKIDHTTPLDIGKLKESSFNAIDKKDLQTGIVKTLQQNSTQKLSAKDVSSLQQRLKNAKKVQQYILDYTKEVSCTDSKSYINQLVQLVNKILIDKGRDSNNLTHIYFHFFKYTLPIIADFFNTKNLTTIQKHLQKFDEMLVDEMLVIEKIYEENLVNFLEKRC